MKLIVKILLVSTLVAIALIAALPFIIQANAEAADSMTVGSNAEAEALVKEIAKVYKEAPAIVDTITVIWQSRNGQRTDYFNVLIGKGTDAQISVQDHTFAAKGNQVYIWRKSLASKYVKMNLNENLLNTIKPYNLPVPYLGLRSGENSKEYIKALGIGILPQLELIDVEQVIKDGTKYAQLNLKDKTNTVSVLVDNDTKLIKSIRMQGPRGLRTFHMKTKILSSLKQEIGIDTSNRKAVATIKDLVLGVGDFAPGFDLPTLDGDSINLQQLRGSVVVLDFWATWCVPCRLGLPKLQEFSDWAIKENLDIEVFAIDIRERQPTNQKKLEIVKQFWRSWRFTMTTLMDYDNKVERAFEVGGIPYTVVIGPDGRIVAVHMGFNPNMAITLKREALKALADAG